MKSTEAYQFERTKRLHETRKSAGLLNRITPSRWRVHHDDRINQDTVRLVEPLAREFDRPVVLSVGAGGGGLLKLTWKTPGIVRIGVDINHHVLADEGRQHFLAVEGSAFPLPVRDGSVDIVLFDYVLHHLVGQGLLEDALREAWRVLRPGGYMVVRDPSSFSPSGLAMNVANKFRLMHVLSGASNYEFAIAPPRLLELFGRSGSVQTVRGLSFLWSRRLPVWVQDVIRRLEPHFFNGRRAPWLADFILYIVRKNG